jgi:hypothetical protein
MMRWNKFSFRGHELNAEYAPTPEHLSVLPFIVFKEEHFAVGAFYNLQHFTHA